MMNDPMFGLAPDDQGFVIEFDSPASLQKGALPVRGRLQVFVAPGSQYAIWSQFPESVRYEIKSPNGETKTTWDLTLSISEEPETYERYAAEPCDQIVGQSFKTDAFALCESFLDGVGTYSIRAIYERWASNWVTVEIVE